MAGMVVLGHVGWKRLQSVPGVGDTENQDYPHTRVRDSQYGKKCFTHLKNIS